MSVPVRSTRKVSLSNTMMSIYKALSPAQPSVTRPSLSANQKSLSGDGSLNVEKFCDAWPWEDNWDRRKNRSNFVNRDPKDLSEEEQIDLLAKAGALIAAEIDRRLRQQQRREAA